MRRSCNRLLAAKLAVLITAGLVAVSRAEQTPDPLAAMRQALGGEAALAAIQTLSFEASTGSLSLELRIAWPDRFLSVARQSVLSPMSSMDLSTWHGFNGSALIARVEGAPLPAYPDFSDGATPDEIARHGNEERQHMLEWTTLLFGPESRAGAVVTGARSDTIDGRNVDVIDFTRWDGKVLHLAIDAATHQPRQLSWLDAPPNDSMITMTVESTVAVRGGAVVGSSPPRTSGPVMTPGSLPGRPDVEHVIVVDQFKTDKGLTWPRRFTRFVAGKKSAESRISKYTINPRFSDSSFK